MEFSWAMSEYLGGLSILPQLLHTWTYRFLHGGEEQPIRAHTTMFLYLSVLLTHQSLYMLNWLLKCVRSRLSRAPGQSERRLTFPCADTLSGGAWIPSRSRPASFVSDPLSSFSDNTLSTTPKVRFSSSRRAAFAYGCISSISKHFLCRALPCAAKSYQYLIILSLGTGQGGATPMKYV